MAYSAIIQTLDRLTAKSVLRGSTSTIAGVIGTIIVFVLCLAIYIPPANSIIKGSFVETEVYTKAVPSQNFVSNKDFKIAVVFRNKTDNKIANHSAIFQYAYSIAYQLMADYSDEYYQPMRLCSDDPEYFKDIEGVQPPSDCFIFPKYKVFRMFVEWTETQLGYMMWALPDPNPFAAAGGELNSNQQKVGNLLQKFYYVVYFTSKVINPDGSISMVMNRFYSTETQPTSYVGTAWSRIQWEIRNTTMDISVMPWKNYKDVTNLVWTGDLINDYVFGQYDAARYGVEIMLTPGSKQLRAFRYYKKLDFLVGIVGGAMLLFYLILWVPFNYINKTVHQIRNTSQLILVNKGREQDPVVVQNLHQPSISWKYWLSNPITNFFFGSVKQESELVMQAERQLDIVWLIKRLKIVQRSLKKRNIYEQFQPKVLKMKEDNNTANNRSQFLQENSANINMSENNSVIRQQNVIVMEQDFEVEEVDDKTGLTVDQHRYIRDSSRADRIFANNTVGLVLRDMPNETIALKQQQQKNKWSGRYDVRKKTTMLRSIFNHVCKVIQKFDLFGARPNLSAGLAGSSFVGLCGTLFIILMTILTVYATLSNANTPQIMILEQFLPEDNFGFTLTPGVDLKFAFCSSYISYLQGSNRYALFRFFYQNQAGRTYFNPSPLTANDYSLFDLTKETSPVNLNYCYKMETNSPIFLGEGALNKGYFGFRIEPYCASTPQFCQSTESSSTKNFLTFMNRAPVYLFLPQNRFNPDTRKFINNLVFQVLNINYFYMNATSMEETLYVDHVQIQDDTKNFFMRKAPAVPFQGIAINPNTAYPLSRMINGTGPLYYQIKIRASSQQINYLITTPKADTILGIIGGVIVLWYAIGHWLGKAYNNYRVRAAQADAIYAEDMSDQNILMKFLAISPVPLCMIPYCFGIRPTIIRMRQVDKKILNDLNYLWLVKYVNNIFHLSSTLFARPQQKSLSKVYIKQKIDESMDVVPQQEPQQRVRDEDLVDLQEKQQPKKRLLSRNKNQIQNEKQLEMNPQDESKQQLQDQKEVDIMKYDIDKFPLQKNEGFSDNYINGHPKPSKFAWMDTFQYPSSLTFKGKREVTSCCGGCCCLILLLFIILVVNFEVGIYLNRSDTRVGMTTSIMQPLFNQSSQTYTSNITLHTGSDFKLAVTFSSQYLDIPHNVSSFLTNGLGISIFQKIWRKINGSDFFTITQIPMVPCRAGYLTESISSLIDPVYYAGERLGYCAPDGLTLNISGLPEDNIRESFTLSIFNRVENVAGRANIQTFLQTYYPKFHFTVPNKDYISRTITYEINSLVFDPYNITSPVQQNITLSKLAITYDDDIGFNPKPKTVTTYNVNPFQQMQAPYYGPITETLYYNLTFDNSFFVQHYTIVGDKFYQTFGIVGGLIAFFIFGFGCLATSFNTYRMRYLIGKELYLFEISRKKELRNAVRGKVRKTKEQAKELSTINNLREIDVFRAYILSFIGAVWQNYNFDPILRRVTLIQQRVEKDIALTNVYKKLHTFRDILNAHYSEPATFVKPADIYLKHIFNRDPAETSLDGYPKLKGYAKKHGWTAFEQYVIVEALKARVNLREVFDSAFLNNVFDLDESITHVNLSNLNGTVQSGTSNNSEVMSRVQVDDQV